MARPDIKTQDIVVLYIKSLLNLREIAAITGISHTAISKRLKKAGVLNSQVSVNCEFCGKEKVITRSACKRSDKHYCSQECYAASLENPGYYPWRAGQRLARAIVSLYYHLKEGNVIHHKDGDNRNNNLANLMVFANQADHLKYHRGNTNIMPLWDGANPIID